MEKIVLDEMLIVFEVFFTVYFNMFGYSVAVLCCAEPVTHVNFTRDGQCVLASCLDSTLRLVDKQNGQVLCK